MDAIELLRINLHMAHDVFNGTVADLTQEMMDWVPPGVAHPIGERYAHAVVAEDWQINQIAQGGVPLFTTTWASTFGASPISLSWTSEDARKFRVDVNKMHDYARAVFPATEAYLNSLDPSAMNRNFDLTSAHMGMIPAPAWWGTFIIGHLHDLMGEISALKGCQGAKGYPF